MRDINNLNFVVGGFAGQGVNTVGDTFARLCMRMGLYVFVNLEYPSNIRGEHNYVQVAVSEKPIGGTVGSADLLLALDAGSVNLHKDEIAPGGVIIYDSEGAEVSQVDTGIEIEKIDRDDITVVDVPFRKIIEEAGGTRQMINSMGLGAVCGLLDLDFEQPASMFRRSLSKLGEKTLAANLEVAKRAYDISAAGHSDRVKFSIERREAPDRMLLTGNHATVMGALKAGVKFYSSYPMSPASGILTQLSRHARKFELVTIMPEDEISAIGMAIGASFAGVRAMTGTSGGGFCLMTEYLGLAAMTEIPLVILEAQRPGPATGLPTRTEQADLLFALTAHQGEFPRIVLAPGDPAEAFYLTFEAFNLADRYQTPVIILSDKHLAECSWTCEPFDQAGMRIDRGELLSDEDLAVIDDYKRFLVTRSGVSPRVNPGAPGGVFKATGNDHDEHGLITEDADNRSRQASKRLRKTESLDVSDKGVKLHGDPGAGLTFVGWGSTKSVILDAMAILEERSGLKSNFLQIIYMEPFPSEQVEMILERAGRTILIENNATGQLGSLIAQKTGRRLNERILKFNGRQFLRDELADLMEKRL